MRRWLILILLCLGVAGALPMGASAPATPPAHDHRLTGMGGCHGEAACAHAGCLGCALEPDAPTLRSAASPPPAALLPMAAAAVLPSRSSTLDPPPPRRG